MLIDCETCEVRGDACGDCVVTVLLGAPPEGVELDADEAPGPRGAGRFRARPAAATRPGRGGDSRAVTRPTVRSRRVELLLLHDLG